MINKDLVTTRQGGKLDYKKNYLKLVSTVVATSTQTLWANIGHGKAFSSQTIRFKQSCAC